MDVTHFTTVPTTTLNASVRTILVEIPVSSFIRCLTIALCVIACVGGSIGNILVILAIAKTKKLRTSANSFIASLAVADLFSCALILPMIAWAFVSLETIITDSVLCRIFYLTVFTFSPVSIEHLTLIAVNRYVLVNKSPMTYVKLFNKHSIPVILALLWAGNIAVNIAYSYASYVEFRVGDAIYCGYQQRDIFSLGYMSFAILFAFLSSFVVIPTLYMLTFRTVRKSQLRVTQEPSTMANTESTLADPATAVSTVPTENYATPSRKKMREENVTVPNSMPMSDWKKEPQAVEATEPSRKPRKILSASEIKIIKINFVIFVTNILFLLPLIIVLIANYGAMSHVLFFVLLLPIGLNSAINPLIYCGFNRNYRHAIRAILRR